MSKLYTAREIATLSLRRIGVVSGMDTSAPEGKVQIALDFLDVLLAERAGTERVWSLVPQAATFTYPADATSCNITSLLGSNGQLDIYRHVYDDTTDDEITLLRREEFDENKSDNSSPHTGRSIYIASDGDDTYTAYMIPTPSVAILLRVTGQRFSNTVAGATNSGANTNHGFEKAWQNWMVNALAVEIGDGPLARLPEDRLVRFERRANESWANLTSRRALGQASYRRFTRAWTG